MEEVIYKLSPSDFAYLWEECKHCYYQKVKRGISQPGIFPSMFGRINSLLQNSIMGMNLQDVHPALPSGIVEVQEGYIKSQLISGTKCYISGRFDILSRLENGTYALIDFKITTPDEEKIQKYKTQLHAYKFALENPNNGKAPLKISKMGVVSINPEEMKLVDGKIVFTAIPSFHSITENMDSFYNLVSEINNVLDGELPNPSEECKLCIYRSYFISATQKHLGDDLPF